MESAAEHLPIMENGGQIIARPRQDCGKTLRRQIWTAWAVEHNLKIVEVDRCYSRIRYIY